MSDLDRLLELQVWFYDEQTDTDEGDRYEFESLKAKLERDLEKAKHYNEIDFRHFAMIFEVTSMDLERVLTGEDEIITQIPSIIKLSKGRAKELRDLYKRQSILKEKEE